MNKKNIERRRCKKCGKVTTKNSNFPGQILLCANCRATFYKRKGEKKC